MKTMTYIILAIIAILIVLIFTGRKSAHHEIVIDASSENVWKVLTNFNNYSNWNPTMQLVEGKVKEGQSVTYQFTQDAENISNMGARVVKVEPNKLLNQKGGMPLVLTFNHRYILSPEGGKTRVTIHEDYRGIGVNFWNPKEVEKAYQRLNVALKKEVEK